MQAMTTQVQLAEDEELVSFAHHFLHKIVNFFSQLNAELAMEETGQGTMARHETRVITKVIDNRKAQLSMIETEAYDRRSAQL